MAREMKDSGVAWIGEIPSDWKLSKIGSLYSQRIEKVSDKDYPPLSVTMKGILPQLATAAKSDDGDNRKLVRIGDFAINSRSDRRGSCGVSLYDGSVSLINIILTPRNTMNSGYYDWLFHTSLFADEFYKWGHGIVDDLWTTRWQEMKSIIVPVPNLHEQERIAHFLNQRCAEIDTVLDKTRTSIEEYKKLKQAIITQAVTKGIRGDRPMKESGIEWVGEIPEEWAVAPKLSNLCYRSISYGIVKLFEPDDEHGVKVLRCSDILPGKILLNHVRTVKREVSDMYARTILQGGEVVINVRGTLGGCAVVSQNLCGYNVAREVAVIPVSNSVNNQFLMYYLLSDSFLNFESQHLLGSVYVGLNIALLSSCPIPCPPTIEQNEIVAHLNAECGKIDKMISKKEQLLNELESYKKSTIYEYVTGKKEVL